LDFGHLKSPKKSKKTKGSPGAYPGRKEGEKMLLEIIIGYDQTYFYTPEKERIVYRGIYPDTPMFDEKGCYIGYRYIGTEPISNTFDEYMLNNPEVILYRWDNKAGAYEFKRAKDGEIETIVVVPPQKIPWHDNGPKPTDLNTLPEWVLESLEEIGEIKIEGEK
jgi:hypothetical protein